MSPTTDPLPASLARIVQRFQRQPKPRTIDMVLPSGKEFPASDKVPENKVPGCVSQVLH